MSILQLDIEGFRSLRKVSWEPGRLTVVIGPNGSGKSNLLRSLDLLVAAANGTLGRYIQQAGGMEPLVWDGQAKQVSIQLRTSPLMGIMPNREITYEIRLDRLGPGSIYRIGHELLADYHLYKQGVETAPFKYLERTVLDAHVYDEKKKRLVVPKEDILEEETLLSLLSGPFAGNRNIPVFQKHLESWLIYKDLDVGPSAEVRLPSITRNERRIQSDGQNLVQVLHTLYTSDRNFEQILDEAMRAAFGVDYDKLVFPPAADQRIQLRVRWKTLRREQTAADLSDGTLRFLFLIAVLATPDPAPLIAIDEPETGLHPSMLPIIAEFAVEASKKAQIIFTTHSDQFLDAFEDTKPQTTVVKWSDGETSLSVVDEEELNYWLREYSLGRLFRSGQLEAMT